MVEDEKMFEVQKFVATNDPPQTVAYNIETFEKGVQKLINFARNNPSYSYRLIEVKIDFIKFAER